MEQVHYICNLYMAIYKFMEQVLYMQITYHGVLCMQRTRGTELSVGSQPALIGVFVEFRLNTPVNLH